jgi:predicted RNA polymerase sigma factor
MARYLILKHYRGGPKPVVDFGTMDQWTPAEVDAQRGEYQAQAAIAALHADARTVDETEWAQIVEWYDELLRFNDTPVVRVNRAVAVGEAEGPRAGLAALAEVDASAPRHPAAEAYLRERCGELGLAARLYGEAARRASNLAERHHLTRQAARLNDALRGGQDANG